MCTDTQSHPKSAKSESLDPGTKYTLTMLSTSNMLYHLVLSKFLGSRYLIPTLQMRKLRLRKAI